MSGNSEETKLFSKFPCLLRNKLIRAELEFPSHMQVTYERIKAYRCIQREPDSYSDVTIQDFQSKVEMLQKRKVRNRIENEDYMSDIGNYGVSLFTNKKILNNAMKLPRPPKKICVGYVQDKGGVQATDEYHVNWWLYENAEIGVFKIEK